MHRVNNRRKKAIRYQMTGGQGTCMTFRLKENQYKSSRLSHGESKLLPLTVRFTGDTYQSADRSTATTIRFFIDKQKAKLHWQPAHGPQINKLPCFVIRLWISPITTSTRHLFPLQIHHRVLICVHTHSYLFLFTSSFR